MIPPYKGVIFACCRFHSMDRLTATFVLLATSAWLLFVMPQQVTAGYSVCVGLADVTGPSAEVGFVSTLPVGSVPCLSLFLLHVSSTNHTCSSNFSTRLRCSQRCCRASVAGQQFPTFETPYCRPVRSRTAVGLPDLKMATSFKRNILTMKQNTSGSRSG
jgi:hypothetical protein